LTGAIKHALQEAACAMHDLDFRITDISGEQYFFREASLAVSRTMHQPKQEFDLWHPAEGIGETGAAAGPAMIATALTACRKGYAKGVRILLHASSDSAQRAAAIVAWTGASR
jgi:3-oxoacyl-[acyl-carrier-protein] synthase-1